jgi:phage recombination protein Bet
MNNQVEKQTNKILYTKEQIELIRSQIAPEATQEELKLFLYQCQRTGLDALSRQIYCIHRWSKGGKRMTIQTSIDGFRVIAERSGNYGGQSEPLFTYENGVLISCKISVFRFHNDIRFEASVGVAYLAEYCQFDKDGKPMGLWAKPHIMLQKVAEALALRKAYPQDLSGIYTSEEMQQADESAYLKAHLTELDVELAVDLCVSKTELKTLYSCNTGLVDNSPELKEIFKTKQSIL